MPTSSLTGSRPGASLLCVCLLLSLPAGLALAQESAASPQDKPSFPNPYKRLSLEELSKVEIVTTTKEPSTAFRTPAAIFVITEEDIRRSGYTTIPDVLRLAPGVEVAKIDSSKWAIGIRGFAGRLSRSVQVLIDGRSVYTPLFAGVYWEVQDTLLEDIERIEVIRGPGATIWGANAVNGVINIITKRAANTHGTLFSLGGGNVDQGSVAFRYGGGNDRNLDYRIYGKAITRGPQFHPDARNFDDWRMGQGGFRTDWKLSDRDELTLQGDIYKNVVGQKLGVSTFSPPAITYPEDNIDLTGGNILGRWRRAIREGSDIQIQAYYDRTHRSDLNFREVRNTFDLDLIHHLKLRGNDIIWGVGARISPSHFIQVVPTVNFSPPHQTYRLFSAFLQDELTILPDRLSFTVGTKLEHNRFSGFEVQPTARLLWTPTRQQTVWAAVTRAVRTPSRIEDNFTFNALAVPALPLYFRLIGDGNFSPEKLLGYEAGFRTFLTPSFAVSINTYYNQYDDLLSVENRPAAPETDPPPSRLVLPLFLRNGITAATKGIEITPAWDVTPFWTLRGSYSFLYLTAQNKTGSNDASTVNQIEGAAPEHKVVVMSRLDLPHSFEFDLTFRHVSGLSVPTVPAYSTADVRLGWRFHPNLEFSVSGQNLLQPHHAEFGGDPGPLVGIRRSVFGKLTWRK